MPVQKGRRTASQVHRDIEDLAAQAAHELDLGMRRMLEMHAANRAAPRGQGVVDLGDRLPEPSRVQFVGAEEALEKSAVIPMGLRCTTASRGGCRDAMSKRATHAGACAARIRESGAG